MRLPIIYRAVPFFLRAAEGEHSAAQWSVGMALLEGWGVEQDPVDAYRWVRKAAEAGDARGQISLATMLAIGQGVDEDDEEARVWYQRGVERNLADSLRGLGGMLVTGEGGSVEPARAWAYLMLAADAGEDKARGPSRSLGMRSRPRIGPPPRKSSTTGSANEASLS
jgi:TPR repeat protein